MGCLSVRYKRIGGSEASAERVGGMTAGTLRLGGLEADAERHGGICACAVYKGGLEVTAALVCAVSKKNLMKVMPKEPQWVDVNLEAIYDIVYPWDWRIE